MKHQVRRVLQLAALLVLSQFAVGEVVTITQADVKKGNIPGTNGAAGFPITIVKPGSYKLGSDIVVAGGTDAIDINASNVALDLDGFSITGPCPKGSCSVTSGTGIVGTGEEITVRNGSIRGFPAYGVSLTTGSIVEEVKASYNGSFGIVVSFGIIAKCTANHNGAGIEVFRGQVKQTGASFNSTTGLYLVESSATDLLSSGNTTGFEVIWGTLSNSTGFLNSSQDLYAPFGFVGSGTNSCSGTQC